MKKFMCLLIASIFLCTSNMLVINAQEPIMQERFTLEEQKIKRAQFIWTACIEELRKDNILNDNEVNNIHNYLKQSMSCGELKGITRKYAHQRKALRVYTVDELIKDKVITKEQGKILRKKLNKYDLTNLDK